MTDVVVIGAGQAGAALAAKLRALGHAGRITLLGAEPAPPYQRPPLSKGYLMGEMGMERLFLRPAEFYAQHDITLRTGATVTAIDRAARRVMVEGESLPYDHLVLTTGATPRRLPAAMGAIWRASSPCATWPMWMPCARLSPRRTACWWWAAAISGWRRRRSRASWA
jgi:3-phenylpropionate/trans-cinnamate dioxygenase ferredoxin reductase component